MTLIEKYEYEIKKSREKDEKIELLEKELSINCLDISSLYYKYTELKKLTDALHDDLQLEDPNCESVNNYKEFLNIYE